MLTLAVVLFALAALGGLTLALMHRQGRDVPVPLALVHGVLAAAGLVVLAWAWLSQGLGGLATLALVLFVVAALGGFYLFAQHLQGRTLRLPIILIHGAVAVVAFVLLFVPLLGA